MLMTPGSVFDDVDTDLMPRALRFQYDFCSGKLDDKLLACELCEDSAILMAPTVVRDLLREGGVVAKAARTQRSFSSTPPRGCVFWYGRAFTSPSDIAESVQAMDCSFSQPDMEFLTGEMHIYMYIYVDTPLRYIHIYIYVDFFTGEMHIIFLYIYIPQWCIHIYIYIYAFLQ